MFRLFDNKKQGNLIIYKVSHTFNHCGRWDLNPHVVSDTRSLVLPVCQFQHFRIHCMKQNCAFHSLRVCKLYDSTAARSCQQNFVKYLKFLQLFQLIIFFKKFLNICLTFILKYDKIYLFAGVAELADAQASGACGSNTVWVQVPSPAVETLWVADLQGFFMHMGIQRKIVIMRREKRGGRNRRRSRYGK